MSDVYELGGRVMAHAFNDELEKIATRGIVKAYRAGKVGGRGSDPLIRAGAEQANLATQAGRRAKAGPFDDPMAQRGKKHSRASRQIVDPEAPGTSAVDLRSGRERHHMASRELQQARRKAKVSGPFAPGYQFKSRLSGALPTPIQKRVMEKNPSLEVSRRGVLRRKKPVAAAAK